MSGSDSSSISNADATVRGPDPLRPDADDPSSVAAAVALIEAKSIPPIDGTVVAAHEAIAAMALGDGDRTPIQTEASRAASTRLSDGMPPMKGDFRPRSQIGSGSFGEVWLAEEWVDGRMFRLVAVKFLFDELGEASHELRQEVEKLAKLAGKAGIVQVHTVELGGERPYYTMDYAPEGSLGSLIKAQTKLPLERALGIFLKLVEALESLHLKGIIHCDLKPENVLLGDQHEPLLADFGQARLRGKGAPNTGSWFYMAPEQLDREVDHAETSCDVYALGAIFYKMLTGVEPRSSEKAHASLHGSTSVRGKLELHRRWLLDAPTPTGHRAVAGIDRPLCAIVDRCLETSPDRRFRDGAHVRVALAQRERCLRKRPVILRGLLATVVLMGALLLTLIFALPAALQEFRRVSTATSLSRDKITAALAGRVIEHVLQSRREALEHWVDDPAVRVAFKRGDGDALKNRLETLIAAEASRASIKRFAFKFVAAFDAQGRRIAMIMPEQTTAPPLPGDELIEKILWNWRGWFNGSDVDRPPSVTGYPPLEKTRISPPYIATYRSGKAPVLTVTAPVRTPGEPKGPITGVLNISIEIKQLYPWIETVGHDVGPATIIDAAGHGVRFRTAESENERFSSSPVEEVPILEAGAVKLMKNPEDRFLKSHPTVHPEYKTLMAKAAAKAGAAPSTLRSRGDLEPVELIDHWVDPVDDEEYPTAFQYLPDVGFGILIQEADTHIERLERQILWIGWLSYVVGLGLVVGLWTPIIRRLRREEQFLHA